MATLHVVYERLAESPAIAPAAALQSALPSQPRIMCKRNLALSSRNAPRSMPQYIAFVIEQMPAKVNGLAVQYEWRNS